MKIYNEYKLNINRGFSTIITFFQTFMLYFILLALIQPN